VTKSLHLLKLSDQVILFAFFSSKIQLLLCFRWQQSRLRTWCSMAALRKDR